jgi:predicted MPP superfamily phosphohydrolase
MTPVDLLDLAVNASMLVADAVVVGAAWRWRARPALVCAVGAAASLAAAAAGGFAWAPQPFAPMRAVSWVLFVHGPVDLLLAAALSARVAPRQAVGLALAALTTVGVAVRAFVIEPAAFDTTFHELDAPGLAEPLRIAVLADIQVDRLTDRERIVLEAAMEQEPDLILLAGDYLQIPDAQEAEYLLEAERWKELIDATLDAPLGVYAVRGNAEVRASWASDLFGGTVVTPFRETASVDLGPVVVTGLSFWDSFEVGYSVDDTDKPHVVFGHGPDFSLSERARGDLLVAGHTHGGQVQLPFLGPLVTFSQIPNAQAAGGLFPLSGGRHLLVSRGIGMERGYAPRLRLFCRPELTIIDLVPPGWVWPDEGSEGG